MCKTCGCGKGKNDGKQCSICHEKTCAKCGGGCKCRPCKCK